MSRRAGGDGTGMGQNEFDQPIDSGGADRESAPASGQFDTREWVVDEMLASAQPDEAQLPDPEDGEPAAEVWRLPEAVPDPDDDPAPDPPGIISGPVSDAAVAGHTEGTLGFAEGTRIESSEDVDDSGSDEDEGFADPPIETDAQDPATEAEDPEPSAGEEPSDTPAINDEALTALVREAVDAMAGPYLAELAEARDRSVEEASKASSARQFVEQAAEQVKAFAEHSAESREAVCDLQSGLERDAARLQDDLEQVSERLDGAESAANAARAAADRSTEAEEAVHKKLSEADARAARTAEEAARREIDGGMSRIAELAATAASEKNHHRSEAAESARAARSAEQHDRLQAELTEARKRLAALEGGDIEVKVASLATAQQRHERDLGQVVVAMEKHLDELGATRIEAEKRVSDLSQVLERSRRQTTRRIDGVETAATKAIATVGARLAASERVIEDLRSEHEREQRRRADAGAAMAKKRSSSKASPGGAIKLNEASFEELRACDLSVTQVARILARRDALEGFASLDQLDELPGIPAEALEKFKTRASL